MSIIVPGLHHVTAISGPPQDNLDFYSGVLGQRLVKKTVNFDAPDTYHLYYGDEAGTPGTILTFFPFGDAGPGRAGPGMSVTLWLGDPEPTARVLEAMGYARSGEEDVATMGSGGTERRLRLVSKAPERGPVVDIVTSDASSVARPGAGTIHHVAFRARDAAEQRAWREALTAAGLDVTLVIDRQYFDAIYFRTPGGVLFEIATDPPGFAVDEDPAHLGEALRLPPRYEPMRERLERVLPPLRAPRGAL